MKEERIIPEPRMPTRMRVAIVVALFFLAALAVWLSVQSDSVFWAVALFVLTLVGIAVATRVRSCPQCGRRMTARFEEAEGRSNHRVFFDCPRCQISWTDGRVHHDDL